MQINFQLLQTEEILIYVNCPYSINNPLEIPGWKSPTRCSFSPLRKLSVLSSGVWCIERYVFFHFG